MKDKIQAILLKTIIELKKLQWVTQADWELSLKSEGKVPLAKNFPVVDTIDTDEVREQVEAHIEIALTSQDELTYFPVITLYANIFLDGGESKDIAEQIDVDTAFTERDLKREEKMVQTASKINSRVQEVIEKAFSDYVDANEASIKNKQIGNI